ncbi:MAG: PLP-dependent aminotransferase family protein [Cyanobacteria bacterium J06597_1]
MKILLDRQSDIPVYLQIREYLRDLIQSGTLRPGDRLPSIRKLAKESQVNKLTAIEAYSVLEGDGLIQARQGSGYFVEPPIASSPVQSSKFNPDQTVTVMAHVKSTYYRACTDSIAARQTQMAIDLSCGIPSQEGLDDLKRIARRVSSRVTDDLFFYDYPQGRHELRLQIARLLAHIGLNSSPDNIVVTSGSMQGISIAFHHYLKPGDWAIVENPTFHGALAALSNMGAKIIGIPMAPDGMNLELLEQYLQSHQPKLIYTISNLHNPTGITTSREHKQRLLQLAQQYQCPVVEDNAYELLHFDGDVPLSIKAMDRHECVTYIGTFTKAIAPGLRVGYMVPPQQTHQALVENKLVRDLHSATLSQTIVSEYLASGYYRRRLSKLRSSNLHCRNLMLQAMERWFPSDVTWTVPQGGLFLWVHLPDRMSGEAVYQAAFERGVVVYPGNLFFADQQGYSAFRLSYSIQPDAIEPAVQIVGDILHDLMAQSASGFLETPVPFETPALLES